MRLALRAAFFFFFLKGSCSGVAAIEMLCKCAGHDRPDNRGTRLWDATRAL